MLRGTSELAVRSGELMATRPILELAHTSGSHVITSSTSRYASGATIQILLFGVLAISLKDVAPSAHTMCEIVRARW